MASENYSYVLTDISLADIDGILEYIAVELLNPDAASSFADSLEEKLEEACRAPRTGRIVENEYLRRDDVRRILIDNYIAYYITDEERMHVVVLRVIYSKRNQDEIIKQL